MPKPFREQDPEEIIRRVILLEYVRLNHIPSDLEAQIPGTNMVEQLYDEDGEMAWFFNWEFMLFECPWPELDHMGQKLYVSRQEQRQEEERLQGIKDAQIRDEIAKRKIQGDAWKGDDALAAMLDQFEAKQEEEKQEKLRKEQKQAKPGAPASSILVGTEAKPEAKIIGLHGDRQ